MQVDKVAVVPLDGQGAEAGALPGVLGAVIDLSVAHLEVLTATRANIHFSVFLGDTFKELPGSYEAP